jgi:hypothetical protein
LKRERRKKKNETQDANKKIWKNQKKKNTRGGCAVVVGSGLFDPSRTEKIGIDSTTTRTKCGGDLRVVDTIGRWEKIETERKYSTNGGELVIV